MRDDYEIVMGLEVHAELSTKTKIFCSCPTEFGADPNTHVCPVCMAMPGALPVLNEKVVEYAVKAGLATNCEIARNSKNDRKNYFYPDLPKSYQISQFDMPLCEHGYIEIEDDEGNKKKIGLTRIHIEEDAGKLNHNEFGAGSLVDLNRAGVPLIEIVSEPDLRSPKEAEQYLKKLKSILEYIEVSDCKMQEGSLRADVNVSVRKKGAKEFGTRTEMKNMNSFRSIVRAIEYEADRQIDVIEDGGKIYQETLRWDDVSGKTFSMRDKEDAQDYRYFPDPDLVAIKLSEEYIENIKNNLPELPESRKARYMGEIGLSEKDARLLTASKYLSNMFEKASDICGNHKAVANWLLSDVSRILNEREEEADSIPFTAEQLAKMITLIDKGTISSAIAKKVLEELFEEPKDPEEIIKEKGWIQISDEGAIKEVVLKIIEEDAGKLNHNEFGAGSLVDLNRAGVPLIEIVSEPDLRSPKEAEQYLKKLKSILEYIEVSDCKMQEGSLRADVNVSVRKKGAKEFGTRTEMKNMNSFRSIVRAIEYEADRQIDVIEDGGKIYQETLRWDDVSGKTFSMRDKEDAQDYRYFPDPDLVAIKLSEEYIQNIKDNLPELPESRKARYMGEIGLSEKDAKLLTASKYLSNMFEKASEICGNHKAVANWLLSDVSRILNEREEEADSIPFTAEQLAKMIILIDKGTISSAIAKKVLEELFEEPKNPEEIIKEKGWIQISDEGAIKEVVLKIIAANPQSVADYKAGKDKAVGFLVGQAMKETKGKANPQMLNKMFIEELNK